MTYCFAFKLNPDGVGIIADQRISLVNSLDELTVIDDSTLKIYSIHDRGVIAIAGNISQLDFVLEGLGERVAEALRRDRFDGFISHCQSRFRELLESGLMIRGVPSSLSIIYADARRRRMKNYYRIVSLDFCFDGESLIITHRPNNRETFVDIGWIPECRTLLSNAAMSAISELESRGGMFELQQDRAMTEFLNKIPKEITQGTQMAYSFDSSGPRSSTYRKNLRRFICQNKRKFNHPRFQFGPIFDFTSAAERAIIHEVERLRFCKAPFIDCVGNKWCHATLTAQRGVFIHPEGDVVSAF